MNYLLDTNAWVNYLRHGAESPIARRLKALDLGDGVYSCSVVRAELVYGAYRSKKVEKNVSEVTKLLNTFESLPFNDAAADRCGHVRSDLDAVGERIGPYDVMIAAIAMANNLTLVTHNVSEFGRIPGLVIEDWQVGN